MNKKLFSKILSRIKKQIPVFAVIMVLSAAYAGLSLCVPLLFGDAVDLLVGKDGVDLAALTVILVKAAVFSVSAAAVQYIMTVLSNRAAYKTVSELREETFEKIHRLPMSYLDKHPAGDIISRFTNDAETFSDGLLLGFTQLFSGISLIIGTLVFMLVIKPSVTAVVVLLTPLSLFTARLIASRTFGLFSKQTADTAAETSFVTETVGEQKTVRALGAERDFDAGFDKYNAALQKSSFKATFFSSLTNPSTRLINAIVYGAVALTGALSVIAGGGMTVGALASFLAYANKYTKPFNEISGVIAELQSAFACAERIFAFLEEKDEDDGGKNDGLVSSNDVTINNMSFSYSPDKPLIENMDFSAPEGKHTAIVGPTGCGKTTFINLLMRYYDVTGGNISVGGVDVRDMSRRGLRKRYGMVLQDTWLRYGTVADNIALSKPGASRAEIEEAARSAHAHGFITRLPKGYDTVIGEDGGGLSAGQKQLLCIARVMLCKPAMLILDEATSSVDTMTEKKIQQAFDTLTEGKTAFIVAHRLSTVLNADEILVMRAGSIVERGTHTGLINKRGFYYDLYQSQFKKGKQI